MKQTINRWLLLGVAVGAFAAPAVAVYNPFPLRDASRPWAISLYTGAGYDDNVNTTDTNREGSFTYTVSPQALLNWAMEETFVGVRYTYGATYFENRADNNWDQSHVADFLFSHTFNPRLVLDLNDSFRRGIDPALVQGNVQIRQVGDYYYNNLSGALTYNLTRQWTVSTSGSWQLWRYDAQAISTNSDNDAYQVVETLLYSVSPQTFVGVNYRFSATRYVHPAPGDANNSIGHAGYLTLIHRFSRQLTGTMNGGYEIREFGDQTTTESPYAVGSVSYSYAPGSAVSLSGSYSLSDTAPGYGNYHSSKALVAALQVSHQVTPKLRLNLDTTYSYSTYQDAFAGSTTASAHQQTFTVGAVVRYSLTPWLSSDLSYSYDIQYGDSSIAHFYRDRVSLGLRFVY
jgi:hypothetical protein